MAIEQPCQLRKQKQPLLATSIIIAFITVVSMTTLIVAGYWFSWAWAGFSNKTLWDWMQLLIVPMVLANALITQKQIKDAKKAKH